MAHFRDWATGGGKTYVSWDATFRNAVRRNWANLPLATTKAKDWE